LNFVRHERSFDLQEQEASKVGLHSWGTKITTAPKT
jgi:hypothetical protein